MMVVGKGVCPLEGGEWWCALGGRWIVKLCLLVHADGTHLDALEEFVKELKMLQRIGRHPNIICLVGAVVKDGEWGAGGADMLM